YHVPFPRNKRFVGRDETLGTLRDMLFVQEIPRVALVGLGGVGKTQVALELACWTKANKADCSVFWVPALSGATFEQAYANIARQLKIPRNDDEDIKESVRQYLSSEAAGRWLLVVDNADAIDVLFGPGGVNKHLPASKSGLMLFTTRSPEVAGDVARDDVVELQELDCKEAAILLRSLVVQKERLNDTALTELLNELTNLPLTIIQAAAYLNNNQVSVAEYLSRLRGAEKEIVDLISREIWHPTRDKGSQTAVAETWLVSFEQIRWSDSAAAVLLSFISCIEPNAIPQSILPRPETEEEMVHAIGTLCGYAFLSRRGKSEMLDMHSLVHAATRVWIKKQEHVQETETSAIRHLAASFPSAQPANRVLWRGYLPHTLCILQKSKQYEIEEKCDLYYRAGQCLHVDQRFKEAISMFKHALAEEDSSRLTLERALASAYLGDRRFQEAIEILEHVVRVGQSTMAEEDHSRLSSEHELGKAYVGNGRRIHGATQIFERVVAVGERTLAKEDN
ncbi:hypothetical protein CONLIGDRAFT_555327, partial [Coniochaeta ligniaria NRRL 30616]